MVSYPDEPLFAHLVGPQVLERESMNDQYGFARGIKFIRTNGRKSHLGIQFGYGLVPWTRESLSIGLYRVEWNAQYQYRKVHGQLD